MSDSKSDTGRAVDGSGRGWHDEPVASDGRSPRSDAARGSCDRDSGRLQGSAPPQAGISGRIRLLPNPAWRDTKKCTESVSPPSSSPDRPSPKRLPGGRAFNLGRSVLGALGKVVAHSTRVKDVQSCFDRKLRHSHLRSPIPTHTTPTTRKCTQKCTEPGSLPRPTSRLTAAEATACRRAINLRRSVLGALGTLGPRSTPRQATSRSEMRSLRTFLYTTHTLASDVVCSRKDGTKDSPSRVRFRPLSRLTFRFRVRPSGRASSYSRPVLGAAAIYAFGTVGCK